MHALILADGDAPSREGLDAAWPGWDDGVALVVAADGGARHGPHLGVRIDRWVGDGDSVDAAMLDALRAQGATIDRSPTDKDESDTELAVLAALAAGAGRLSIVGALGGPRLDHALANLTLLSLPELADLDVRILAAEQRIRLLVADGLSTTGSPSMMDLAGRIGDLVSLLPVGADALGVTTEGLRYPLRDEPLLLGRTRGLSNVRADATARVSLRAGHLLVVEGPATLST
ncbi:MAG: thiamine diphosphokinase [Candidatus Limnocylindrales bacterium]